PQAAPPPPPSALDLRGIPSRAAPVGLAAAGPLRHGRALGRVPSVRRPSARWPQLMGKPRLGRAPVTKNRSLRDAEQLRTCRHIEAAEKPGLDYQRLTRLKAGKLFEGGIEAQ